PDLIPLHHWLAVVPYSSATEIVHHPPWSVDESCNGYDVQVFQNDDLIEQKDTQMNQTRVYASDIPLGITNFSVKIMPDLSWDLEKKMSCFISDDHILDFGFPPPLRQVNHGIPEKQVICQENYELVYKTHSNFPACVKPSTVEKLIERGWSKNVINMSLDKSVDVTCTTKFEQENKTYSVRYDISNAQITEIRKDGRASSLILSIIPESSGSLHIEIPRGLLDAKMGHDLQDDIFFTLLDGKEVNLTEVGYTELKKTDEYRLLEIEFEQTTNQIEIIGTYPLPIMHTINTCD
ncbi:MAG: hypothetical protein J4F36_12985, partial [Nitrosopumilaceae archaeon]|nr:hypothetical protein [Nitrosopumilaceae archaeon]